MSPGDSIRYKKQAGSRSWDRAELLKRIDDRNYLVKNAKGNVLIRNRKHLLKTEENEFTAPVNERDNSDVPQFFPPMGLGGEFVAPSLPVSDPTTSRYFYSYQQQCIA